MHGGEGNRGDLRFPRVGTTGLRVVGVATAVLTLASDFFLDFPEARLGAAVDLSSCFLGLAVSLVAVTSRAPP